jgi:hypothetical protein
MNCKNCKSEIPENDSFCNNCGAKIIKERITIKSLFLNFLIALGWDSNFFITLRFLLSEPQTIIKEYINGTRKKYTNPFTFFAISLAISLFIFNQYSEQYIRMSTTTNIQQNNELENVSASIANNNKKGLEILGYKNQGELQKSIAETQLKYHNLISFLFLPIFTLIAFLVFRKPYNYGEHFVINTYFLGITTFFGVLTFIFILITKYNILLYATIFTFLYYSYAYKKVYELSFGKLLLKILKFICILLLVIIVLGIISILIGSIFAMIRLKN